MLLGRTQEKEQIGEMSEGNMDLTRRINIVSFDDVGEMTSGMNDILIKFYSRSPLIILHVNLSKSLC